MYILMIGLYVLICFLLLVVVLLQQGKGGDISAAFGGSSSQTAFGARSGATFLTRATAVLATLFMLVAFGLGVMGKGGGGSVVSGVQAPASTTPAAPDLNFGKPLATPPPTPTKAPDAGKPTPTRTPEAAKPDPKNPARGAGSN